MSSPAIIPPEYRQAVLGHLEHAAKHPMWMAAVFWIDDEGNLRCMPTVFDMPKESFNKAGTILSQILDDGLKNQNRKIVAPGNGFTG